MQRHAHARRQEHRGRPARSWGRSALKTATASVLVLALAALVVLVSRAGLPDGRHHRQQVRYAASHAAVPLLGSSVLSAANLGTDTSEFGHMPIVRVYYPGLPAGNAWTSGLAGANHSAVIVSFKAQPSAILSGADDVALSHFFDSAPTGHPIYYSYYHEPEDNIAAGQFSLAGYKAAWHRVVALADAAHNADLHSTLILMEWDLQKASGRNWRSYLPAGGIISTLGWDAYPQGSATNEDPQLTPPAAFMGPAIAASRSVGLPFGFAEFGLSTSRDRTAWLTSVGNYLMTSGALFGSYFDGNTEYPTLRLSGAAEIGVWRGFVARSAAGASRPSPQPSPSPSPSQTTVPVAAAVKGLTVSPSAFAAATGGSATISFTLAQQAYVTVCVLGSDGSVQRLISRPGSAVGLVSIDYNGTGPDGHRLPAGRYQVLVVASNATGSATAETTLTLGGP